MFVEVDKLFAECIGFQEIEHTDYGGIVGRSPDGSIRYIPSPSSKIGDFHSLLQYMLVTFKSMELTYRDSKVIIKTDCGTYAGSDLKTAVLKAFLGGINARKTN